MSSNPGSIESLGPDKPPNQFEAKPPTVSSVRHVEGFASTLVPASETPSAPAITAQDLHAADIYLQNLLDTCRDRSDLFEMGVKNDKFSALSTEARREVQRRLNELKAERGQAGTFSPTTQPEPASIAGRNPENVPTVTGYDGNSIIPLPDSAPAVSYVQKLLLAGNGKIEPSLVLNKNDIYRALSLSDKQIVEQWLNAYWGYKTK